MPRLLVGDFNDIRSVMEQKGGAKPNFNRCMAFNEWINT